MGTNNRLYYALPKKQGVKKPSTKKIAKKVKKSVYENDNPPVKSKKSVMLQGRKVKK